MEKAFLGLCNCATEIVNHGRLILILCLVIQGMDGGGTLDSGTLKTSRGLTGPSSTEAGVGFN